MNNPTTITTPSTATDTNVELIANLYAAYGRGDLDGFVADLADDVDWAAEAHSTSVPWYGHYHGRSQVPSFIQAIAANVEVTEFTVVGTTSNDTDVVATIHWTYTVNSTGKTAAMFMQHWWRIDNGKIVWFRGSEDTEQSAAAFRH
jgi:uncharacterized protein